MKEVKKKEGEDKKCVIFPATLDTGGLMFILWIVGDYNKGYLIQNECKGGEYEG